MIKPSKSLNVRISAKLEKELKAISKKERIPLSDLVRESLRQYVGIRRFRQLRNQVLPFAESQGLLSDEDIFRAMS